MAATYTVKQVAQILGYSTNSIYTFLKEKRIKGVRVGTGRFRIPQSELDRLLLSGKPTQIPAAGSGPVQFINPIAPVVLPSGVVETPQEGLVPSGFLPVMPQNSVDVPSLFDWFTGMSSIILGLAMFLFSRMYEEFSLTQFSVWTPAIRAMLIFGGFGLLLTDVVGRKRSVWHTVFHWVLLVAYVGYTAIAIQTGSWEEVVIFGMLALVLLLTTIVRIGGIAGFAIYVVSLVALLPSVMVLAPSRSTLTPLAAAVPIPLSLFTNIWIIGVLAVALIIWFGYLRERHLFWVGMTGVSILLIGLSVHYAQNISWGRSLFILITGILSFFVPIWQTLTFSHKRDRAFIYGAFGTLLILFILVVGVIRIMQTNIMDYASREMTNKVSYGKTLLETTILSTKTTLSSAAMNPLMVTAMSDKNDKDLLSLSRALFEGNTMFRRVVLVDDKGVAQAVYPYSVQDSTVYGTQNYVIEAFSTKRLVTSDVFDVTADTVKHKGIVIAAPILSATGTVEGVIAGFVDLDTLGNKLEQLASTITGEYFYVVDSMGRVLIHLDKSKIGSLLNLQNQNYVESPSGQNVREEYGSNGTRLLESYAQVGESTGWVVALEVPVAEILLETNAAGITIVAVIILSILIVGMFFLSHRTQVKVAETMVNVRHRIPEPEKPTKPRLSAKHTRVRTDTS